MHRTAIGLIALILFYPNGSEASGKTGFFGIEVEGAGQGGARITTVAPNSPAAQLGLRPGYVVVGLGRRSVATGADVSSFIQSMQEGEWERIAYLVGKSVHAGLFTIQDASAHERGGGFILPPRGLLGIQVADLARGEWGARITRVDPGRAGDVAGLRYGDIIVQVNGTRVQDSSDVSVSIAHFANKRISLTVWRRGQLHSRYAIPDGVSAAGSLEREEELGTRLQAPSAEQPWCTRGLGQALICAGGAYLVVKLIEALSGGSERAAKATPNAGDKSDRREAERERQRALGSQSEQIQDLVVRNRESGQ